MINLICRFFLILFICSFINFSLYANPDQTNSKIITTKPFYKDENCSTPAKAADSAKKSALIACHWIEDIGLGDKNNAKSAAAMIVNSRFCGDNYIWVLDYLDNVTATSHLLYKITLLHPVKPALEQSLNQIHKDFGEGFYIVDQQLFASSLSDDGCWIKYNWTKPGTLEKSEKITFVKKCKDKSTGKFTIVGAGLHAPHDLLITLNPPQCKKAEVANPYNVKKKK
ncbi:MAG: cache domain-containing protein [Oligoflexia bacterium]|nr:cache domain-containing protein [Oligoflexia bacterium]